MTSMSRYRRPISSVLLPWVRSVIMDREVMMHSRNLGVDDEILDELGDAAALESTSQFANRVKCALLGWYALRDALAKSGIDISAAGEPDEQ